MNVFGCLPDFWMVRMCPKTFKVGDLVDHILITKATGAVGIIIETPAQTQVGDYLVFFGAVDRKKTLLCSYRTLKLLDK